MARVRLTDYPKNHSFRNIVEKLNQPEAKQFLPKNAIALPRPYQGELYDDVLLSQYAGNPQYRNINSYLRAEGHQEGLQSAADSVIDSKLRNYHAKQILKKHLGSPDVGELTDKAIADAVAAEKRRTAKQIVPAIPYIEEAVAMQPTAKVTPENPFLRRGMYFDSEEALDAFLASHVEGQPVTYKSFTSTTTNPEISEGFSVKREGFPLEIAFMPKEGAQRFQAHDVRNPLEGEYVYRPNSQFEVIAVDPGERGSGRRFARLVVQEL